MASGNREGEKKLQRQSSFLWKIRAARTQRDIPSWVEKKKEVESDIIVQSFFIADDLASELATNGRKSRLTFFFFSKRKSSFSLHSLRPRSTCCEEELRLLGPFPRVSEEDFLELSKSCGDKLASAREADTFDKSFRFALRPPDFFLLPTIAAWWTLRR